MIWLTALFGILLTQDGWIQLTSTDGNFSINCPGPMKEHIIASRTLIGEIKYHTFSFEKIDSNSNTSIFMVSYYDYPVDFALEDSVDLKEALYQASIEEATQSISGELIYAQDDFSYSKFGKIWRINFKKGAAYVKTKAFFDQNRFYSIQIVTTQSNISAMEESKFFKSFKLLRS